MGVDQQGNAILGALLGELAWSPSLLAEAVNGVLGPGYVARSTVSDWLNHDRVPRDPLPTVVAHMVSDALDREVSVAQLWSGRAQPAEFWVPADAGLRLPWTAAGTVMFWTTGFVIPEVRSGWTAVSFSLSAEPR